jgi:thymidylate synthase (FAD)
LRVLDKGFVEVKEIHGSDLTIVNAARVSFGKEVTEFSDREVGLLNYLAKNKHSSPFRQCGIIFHIKMPIFVMRQFIRHRVGVEVNEISGRYVEFDDADFYTPDNFRYQSTNNKQGSAEDIQPELNASLLTAYTNSCNQSFDVYKQLISQNVAKEMARMALPLSLYTEIRVFMSLEAISHFVHLREDNHAQYEIRQYSDAIKSLALEAFPNGFNSLMEFGR